MRLRLPLVTVLYVKLVPGLRAKTGLDRKFDFGFKKINNPTLALLKNVKRFRCRHIERRPY